MQVLLVLAPEVNAASLTVQWDPSADQDTAGYVVAYGTVPGVYTQELNAGLATTFDVDGLGAGKRYCFAVRAYSDQGVMSDVSNEVCTTTAAAPSGGGGNNGNGGGGNSGGGGNGGGAGNSGGSGGGNSGGGNSGGGGGGGAASGGGGGGGSSSGGSSGGGSSSPAGGGASGSFALSASLRNDRFVDLSWSAAGGASSYRVEAGRRSGETAVSAVTGGLSSTIDLGALGGGTFFVRVRPIVNAAMGAASSEAVVTVGAGSNAPQAFAVSLAGRTAQLSWQPPADGLGATAFQVEIGNASGASNVSVARVAGLSLALQNLADGVYYMRVRAIRGGPGDASREARIAITGGTAQCSGPPPAPTAFSAAAQGSLVSLSWQPGSGEVTTAYMLLVGSAPGLQDLLTLPLGPVTGLSATTGNGVYALRLLAGNPCGVSPWGAETIVTVGTGGSFAGAAGATTLPGVPEGVSYEMSGRTVVLRWTPPATGGTPSRYIIEASTAAGPLAVDTGHAGTTFSHPNTPAGQYVVRIRAANAAGAGSSSAPITVVVP